LTARAVVAARNVGQGVGRTFTARISPDAEIKSVSVGDASARFVTRAEARTKLQQVQVTLPAPVTPGGSLSVAFEYRMPVTENTGLAAVSAEGSQFLPLSFWYPTPNSLFAQRGADYAPVRITVNNLTGGETIVSSGRSASGGSFEQALNAQPFFLTGAWETIEGASEANGISALVNAGAGADERRRAEALVALTAAARTFYAGLLGPAPDSPVRIVGVRRGAGFETAGTLLVDHAVFRRTKTDSVTALQIAETVARLWVGGATNIQGEGGGALREGLPRFLAMLFLEKQFGKEIANAEGARMALLYAPIARRDAPLAQTNPAVDTYYTSASNKGALVWRLLMNAAGRDAFMEVLRRELSKGREGGASLASLRAALTERGGENLARLLAGLLDQPTDTDLLAGLPQQRAGVWAVALRNLGSLDAEVTVAAVSESGERLTTVARVPAKDFGEAQFRTTARLVRAEVDPDKLYPQVDYSNDAAPRAPTAEEAIAEARSLIAQREFARAESAMREVLLRASSNGEARVVLGRALLEQNKLDEADREFRAALDTALPAPTTLAWAAIGLGETALRRNQAAEAAKRFDEAARAEAEYASSLAARAARIKAESAAGTARAVDEAAKTAVAALDLAIRSGKKAELEAVIAPGELSTFSKGIIGSQPELWQTRVLRTEMLGASRVSADVSITARTLGRDQSGTAVLVFSRLPGGLKLTDIQFFEVR
jgi:tetratricopeptide (TPR) repeat protein